MLLSKLVGDRVKETPSDVTIASHALLLRAGFIKPVANGIYSLTNPAQEMSRNIENIIREEMNAVDGQEVKFPVVMPRELWEQSGRYSSIGSEMARFKDRNGRDLLLGMTHEEAAVHLCKNTVSSYTQLPFMIYQIQTKFRDEPRPRGGLIRVREFTMKDGYSFHMTQKSLEEYYDRVFAAYKNIFRRIGMKRVVDVRSDTGFMGGSVAHEFMLLTEVGENSLVLCDKCGYRSNMEVAKSVRPPFDFGEGEELREVFTGEAKEISEVCDFLKIDPRRTAKAVVFAAKGEDRAVVVFIRGDLEVNEAKLRNVLGKDVFPWTGEGLAFGNIGCAHGGPEGTIRVFDESLKGARGMVTGANREGYHLAGLDVERDAEVAEYRDVAKAKKGDFCPVCGAPLDFENGIEVGNIFQLGTKYTGSMGMTVLDEKGNAVTPYMGCYGIGVGRALASVAQESNDDKGMILPATIAPYKVHICPLRVDDPDVRKAAFSLYDELRERKTAVLIDDRTGVSNGVKFADADLMGMPFRAVVSPRGVKNGTAEIRDRATLVCEDVPFEKAADRLSELIAEKYAELN